LDSLTTLGTLLGLGLVSGIRLYSTVLAVGLGIRFGFLALPPELANLEVLATTPVLVIAGVVYLIEFLADKIPFVDSLWDLGHTFIRPVGAAVLAATAIGPVDPVVKVSVILACGFVAFSGHSAKAGTRAFVNQSPEPFSNIGLSLGEDGLVFGGVWLSLAHPLVMLVVVILAVGAIIWLVPKLIKLLRRHVQRAWRFATSDDAC
jgi:uncharacterized membrane protein YccF (DUF307 family)